MSSTTTTIGGRTASLVAAGALTLGAASCVKPGPVATNGNGTPIPESEVAFRTSVDNVFGSELAFMVISFEGEAFMRTPDGENLTTVDQDTLTALDAALTLAGFGGDRVMPVAVGPITCSPDGYRFTVEYDEDLSIFDDCDIPEGFDATYDTVVDILNDLDPASQ